MTPRDLGARRQRVIGAVRGETAGPTLVCTGSLHGDEPSGVLALQRILRLLEEHQLPIRGEFVALAGNLSAMVADERYLSDDLNRHWSPDNIRRARETELETLSDEDRELRELLDALHELFERSGGELHFLDLHTSSADGQPFVCIGDTLRNRRFAEKFCVPVILGLEEQIDGSLLEYVNNLGYITVGVEGGQHRAETSVDHHEAVVWLALVSAGLLRESEVPEIDTYRQRLRRVSRDLTGFMEVRHRHPIEPADEFAMEEGFTNFQHIRAGQLLAHDRVGEVHAAEGGRILLPLYQGLGSDGFFIARDVNSFWLRLSSGLRRLGLDRALHWLPGVRRHPEREGTLIIDTHLARWFALEVFHLLGYRKRRSVEGKLVVSRRLFDHRPPEAD